MKKIFHLFIIMIIVSCPIKAYSNKNYLSSSQITHVYQHSLSQQGMLSHTLESEDIFDPTVPIFTIKTIIKTIDTKKLQLALGLALMMFISLIKGLNKNISKEYLPWITIIISMLLSGLLGLYFNWPRDKIFIDALTISTCAGGLWSLIGKHILNVDY